MTAIDSAKVEDLVTILQLTNDRLAGLWLLLTSYVTISNPLYVYFVWYR